MHFQEECHVVLLRPHSHQVLQYHLMMCFFSSLTRAKTKEEEEEPRVFFVSEFCALLSTILHFLHFFPFFSVFSVGGRTKGGLGLYGLGFRRKLIFFCGKFFTRTLRVHHSNALLRHELDTHKRTKHAGRKPPNGGEQRPGRRSSRVTSHTNRDEGYGFFRREE